MEEDIQTQQQAAVIARDYNFVPYDPLMCERVIPQGTTRSLFFANVSNIVKIHIQYDRDELIGWP